MLVVAPSLEGRMRDRIVFKAFRLFWWESGGFFVATYRGRRKRRSEHHNISVVYFQESKRKSVRIGYGRATVTGYETSKAIRQLPEKAKE